MPPPDLATEHDDPRRPAGTAPGLDVRHISAVDGPTEDNPVYGLHFHGQELGWPLPTYTRWWRDADQVSALAYHDRVLRLLHSSRPPYQWLLKAPAYLFFLPQVVAQYPGARFLMTHRDPRAWPFRRRAARSSTSARGSCPARRFTRPSSDRRSSSTTSRACSGRWRRGPDRRGPLPRRRAAPVRGRRGRNRRTDLRLPRASVDHRGEAGDGGVGGAQPPRFPRRAPVRRRRLRARRRRHPPRVRSVPRRVRRVLPVGAAVPIRPGCRRGRSSRWWRRARRRGGRTRRRRRRAPP